MAQEQGTDKPDGNFARASVGSAVNTILDNVGPDGRRFPPRAEPPAEPEPGDLYLADGTNFDPAGSGNAALVIYLGGAFVVVNEFTGVGGV